MLGNVGSLPPAPENARTTNPAQANPEFAVNLSVPASQIEMIDQIASKL